MLDDDPNQRLISRRRGINIARTGFNTSQHNRTLATQRVPPANPISRRALAPGFETGSITHGWAAAPAIDTEARESVRVRRCFLIEPLVVFEIRKEWVMPTLDFLKFRKSLPQKEYTKLVEGAISIYNEAQAWKPAAEKFLNGGKLPAKNAGDLDEEIVAVEKQVLAAQQKVKPPDPKADKLKELVDALQALKIQHREMVGTLVSQFEGLDSGGATEVAKDTKAAKATTDKALNEVQTEIGSLVKKMQAYHKEANGCILRQGGYVKSQRDNTQQTENLLGRKLKSKVDVKSFEQAQKDVTMLEEVIEHLQSSAQVIKRL
jgi:hypothetical protein